MIVFPIAVSSLITGTNYNNLKLSMLQRGVLVNLIVNTVNSDGTFDVSLTYNDGQISEVTMASDAVVFEVDDELINTTPID